ncbi:MAG TPA: tyrosine-type recombinase/integrase [Kineosporiaceae bacterium]|nr:tyrosine-type recombinase/integrase [Kineosporiaceae bacterium]
MSIDLRAAAGEYLQARRARGHRLAKHGLLISSFLDGLAAQNATTITRDNVLAFATAPTGTGRAWQAFRLSTIRGFAGYVHGLDPEAAELIPNRLIPATYARRIPYLYSPAQIRDLMTTSMVLLPPPLNVTMTAFIGLIAATGMRGGEAVALDSDDFDAEQGLLTVTGKYGRQRVLPLHASTVTALTTYWQTRAGMTPAPVDGPFFVGATGKRLTHTRADAAFRLVVDACDLPTSPGARPPRIHDLRHTFAVNSLIDAHREGVDVDARIAALATYLGHVNPLNTYWYLTASAELMALVSDRITAYRQSRP